MRADWAGDAVKRVLHKFPERELFLRSGGEISYYVISTRVQLALVSALIVMALWCLLSMITLIGGNNPFGQPAQQMRQLEAHYVELLDDSRSKEENAHLMLEQQRADFARAAKNFEEKHQTISQILKSNGQNIDVTPISGGDYADSHIMQAPVTRDAVPRQSRRQSKRDSHLDESYRDGGYLDGGATDISKPLNDIRITQDAILISAETDTLERIEHSRAVLKSTGLNIESVLRANNLGKGGPFIDLNPETAQRGEGATVPQITQIKARLAEAEALDSALSAMPLGHPVNAEYFLTSPYGTRKDPFTNRPTFHGGIDFGSYRSAPIVATAAGTVDYVGWRGGYGRVVEIEHGYGFVTRYAHLSKTHVKRGQKVDIGDKIGGMGSSGRSTSTHLHYEILFEDQDVNPKAFLKAAQYVR